MKTAVTRCQKEKRTENMPILFFESRTHPVQSCNCASICDNLLVKTGIGFLKPTFQSANRRDRTYSDCGRSWFRLKLWIRIFRGNYCSIAMSQNYCAEKCTFSTYIAQYRENFSLFSINISHTMCLTVSLTQPMVKN